MSAESGGRTAGRRLLINALANYAGEFTVQATGIILTPIIIAALGSSQYGLWVLIVAIQGFGGLFDLGLTTSVVKYVAEHHTRGEQDEINRVVSTAFMLHLGIGTVTALAAGAGALWGLPLLDLTPAEIATGQVALLIAGLGLWVGLPLGVLGSVLVGLRRFERANAVTAAQTLLAAIAIVISLQTGGGPVALVAINSVALAGGSLARWLLARRVLPGLRLGAGLASVATLRRISGYSLRLFLLDTATNLFNNADAVMISAFLPVSAVTSYNLGVKPASAVSILNRPFANVFLPAASELEAHADRAALRRLALFGTRGTLLITLPAVLWLLFFGGPILQVWVGSGHTDALPVLYIFLAVYLVSGAQKPAAIILKGIGRVQALAAVVVVEYVINIALSLVLIPRVGVAGAALGTLIPAAANDLLVIPLLLCRALDLSYARFLRETFGGFVWTALPAGALLWLTTGWLAVPNLLAVGAAGMLAVLLTGAFYLLLGTSRDEKQRLRRQLRLGRLGAGP